MLVKRLGQTVVGGNENVSTDGIIGQDQIGVLGRHLN